MWMIIPQEKSNDYYPDITLSGIRQLTPDGPSFRGKLHFVYHGTHAICGAESDYYWSIDVIDPGMDILPEVGGSILVQLEGIKDHICAHCLRVFKANTGKDLLDLIALTAAAYYEQKKGLRWAHVPPENPTVRERLQEMLDKEEVSFLKSGPPGIPKTQFVERKRSQKDMPTSKIRLVLEVEFDLEADCPLDTAEAIHEIVEKAREHGSTEVVKIVSDYPLEVDVS